MPNSDRWYQLAKLGLTAWIIYTAIGLIVTLIVIIWIISQMP